MPLRLCCRRPQRGSPPPARQAMGDGEVRLLPTPRNRRQLARARAREGMQLPQGMVIVPTQKIASPHDRSYQPHASDAAPFLNCEILRGGAQRE